MTDETYKILIVDDEEPNRKLMSRFLTCDQYTLYTAENGAEALELAKAIRPDLVLLDVSMPVMDGAETCRILKNSEDTSRIPVIMLTAYADKDTKLRCLRAGANEFLAKPIDIDELQLRVNNLLEFKRHADTRRWNELLLQSKAAIESKNSELEEALQEIKTAQAQIIQQEKMASIGQIAAGVAHEINNPVGFIGSNLGTLSKYVNRFEEFIKLMDDAVQRGCSDEAREEIAHNRHRLKIDSISKDIHLLIAESMDGTERVKKIVQDLKAFSHSGGSVMVAANINECLENTINVVWNEIKYVASLSRDFGDIPLISCNPQQLKQVFLNLLVNAAHSIDKQGEIIVRTLQDGGFITVSITDTGSGMSEEIQRRIFEPFFTTKEVGKGTGLGLSISCEIVKKHGGELMVQSEVGKGTTIIVRLPIEHDEMK